MGDHPVPRRMPTHKIAPTQNKRAHTSLFQVGFEPSTSVLERVNTVQASDRTATVLRPYWCNIRFKFNRKFVMAAGSHYAASPRTRQKPPYS